MRPEAWGHVAAAAPRHVNVEFVSANPTGPLTIGNARGAFVGDLLCRILEAGGEQVTREYYFNDSGSQVGKLQSPSVATACFQATRPARSPDDGYHGDYVADLAAAVPEDVWAAAEAPDADGPTIVGRWASEGVRAGIEASLDHLGVHFADVWKTGNASPTMRAGSRGRSSVRAGGSRLTSRDCAVRPFRSGLRLRRRWWIGVIIRANGEPTYFASDIGYVTEKFSRGFDQLIYIWGQDHHGTVARVRNAAEAMGYDKAAVQMLLVAWVRFVRDGVEVSMSKRAGTFVTLDELLAEIGVDAARWFFASRGPSSAIDFDIELAKKQSNENPVYYVQYAHARIASILRRAAEVGLSPAATAAADDLIGAGGDRRGRRDPARRRWTRGRDRGGPGRHGLCHRARLDLPCLLPRREGRRPSRSRAVGGPAGARVGDQDDPGQCARPARDLGPGADVADGLSRPGRARCRER